MKFCLGTAQFGFPYGLDKSYYVNIDKKFKEIIEWNQKIKFFNYLDTAFNYGNSEKIIGENISQIHKVKIISKFSYEKKIYSFEKTVENLHQSLENLKINSFYGILVHEKSMFSKKRLKTTIKILDYIQKNKIAKKIGISVYDKSELKNNLKHYKFDLIQLPLNIFNQSFNEDNYLKEISKNYEVFVRSIFLQGLLFNKFSNTHKYFKKYKLDLIKYSKFLDYYNISPLEACIYYIFSLNLKLNIVFGANDLSNIIEIYKTINNIDRKKIKKINFSEIKSKKIKLYNPLYWKIKQ